MSSDPTCILLLGDCLEEIENLGSMNIDAVITDPPYGIDVPTNYKSRGRGHLAQCNDFPPIVGDDREFDPTPFLNLAPVVVMFGANYFARHLPPSGGWIVWDKLDGLESKREWGFNDNSDCELIWTNVGKAARILRHRWMGAMKGSEHGERRVHPTQKPVAVMEKIIRNYTKEGDIVLDPFMGSGSTGVACMNLGRGFIGIEISPKYYVIAGDRIRKASSMAWQPTLIS